MIPLTGSVRPFVAHATLYSTRFAFPSSRSARIVIKIASPGQFSVPEIETIAANSAGSFQLFLASLEFMVFNELMNSFQSLQPLY